MIDYLQLMNANGMKFGSRQEEVSKSDIVRWKDWRKSWISYIGPITVEPYCRNREGLDGKRPVKLSDLRESGAIERDADMVYICSSSRILSYLSGWERNDFARSSADYYR